jgi:hypothetical protein
VENGKHTDRAKQPAPDESWRSSELCGIIQQRQAFFGRDYQRKILKERERERRPYSWRGKQLWNDGDDPDTAAIVKITFTTTFQLA